VDGVDHIPARYRCGKIKSLKFPRSWF
jgi:hypothetical protein